MKILLRLRNIKNLKCSSQSTALSKSFLFLNAVAALLFLSCNAVKSRVTALHFKESAGGFTLDNSSLIKVQSNVYGNKDLLSFLDNKKGVIYIYNYTEKIFIDSIDVKLRKTQYLFNYQLLTPEQVLLSINTTYLQDLHDSAICIVDRNHKILKKFNFKGTAAPLIDIQNPRKPRSKTWDYSIHTDFPVKLNPQDSTVIATMAPFASLNCDSLNQKSLKFAYKLSDKEHVQAVTMDYDTPQCSPHYNPAKKITLIPYGDYGRNNEVVFGFPHSSRLLGSRLADPELHLYKILNQNTFLEYKRLVYDPFRQCYWWVIEIQTVAKEKTHHSYFNYYAICLDLNLKVISEGFMPLGTSQYIIPLKEGLLIKNLMMSDRLGKSHYNLYKPEFNSEKLENLKQQLAVRNVNVQKDLRTLFDTLKGKSNAQQFLLLSLDSMPPGYATIVMNGLLENKNKFGPNSIHIFCSKDDKVPVDLKAFVTIHRYDVLKNHIQDFIWPAILNFDAVKNNAQLKTYASPRANELMQEILLWAEPAAETKK